MSNNSGCGAATYFHGPDRTARNGAQPNSIIGAKDSDLFELWFEPARSGGAAYGAVYWRWRGDGAYREAPLAHGGENLVARVTVERGGTIEYYAEARSPTGLAQAGTRERPLELPVKSGAVIGHAAAALVAAPPDKQPIAKKWWLWTAVGAVAAAGVGVGLYFALRPTPSNTADAVLDFQVR